MAGLPAMFKQKHTSLIAAIAFQDDTVMTGSYDKSFKVWAASSGVVVHTEAEAPTGAVCSVALHTGTASAFATWGATTTQYSLNTFTVEASFVHNPHQGEGCGQVKCIAVSGDGSMLLTGIINVKHEPDAMPQIKLWDVRVCGVLHANTRHSPCRTRTYTVTQ